MVLRQPEPVVVTSRKIADVEADHREARDLHGFAFGEETISDATLIEHLDRAGVETSSAHTRELLARAPFDDGHVDPRERQLTRQHEPRWTSARDQDCMVSVGRTAFGLILHFDPPALGGSHLGQALCGTLRGLRQAPRSGIRWQWEERGAFSTL